MNNILDVICAGATGPVAYLLCALIVIIAVIAEVFAVLIFLNYRSKKENTKKDLPLSEEAEPLTSDESNPLVENVVSEFVETDKDILPPTDLKEKRNLTKSCLPSLSKEERNAIFDEVFTATVQPLEDEVIPPEEDVNSVQDSFAVMEEVAATDLTGVEDDNVSYDSPLNVDGYIADNGFLGGQIRVRYIRSFTAKLAQSNDLLKERYSALKNELMSYKKVKPRKSWHCETFRLGRPVIAKFAIIGKTLSLYLALSPGEFADSKYIFKDVSAVKKYSAVPMRLKIKSNRSVRWAKELIAILAEQNGWKRSNLQEVDYYPEYRTTEELIMDKEIKLMGTENTEITADQNNENNLEDINERLSETAATGFTAYTDPLAIILEVDLDETGAEEVIEEPVEETEAVLEETVEETVEETIEEPVEEPEVIAEEAEEAVEESVEEPAEEIVEETEAVEEEPAEEIEEPEEEVVEEPVVELPERDFEFVSEVSATSADKEMTDEKAESLIETLSVSSSRYGGKGKAIVNIDTLSENYNAGEVVTIENLKAKKLVPKKAGSVKILGRGIIDKPLTVEADGFTINAAKMILLTGGRVIRTVE